MSKDRGFRRAILMTTTELRRVLKEVYDMAEARENDEYLQGTWGDINSKSWARIVKLMNLKTAAKDVMRYWKECGFE